MSTQGLLTQVLVTERGSNAAEVAAVGATEILVADVTDFTDYTAADTTDPETQAREGIGIVIDVLGERYTVATVTSNADEATPEGAGEEYDLAAGATPGTLTLTEPVRVQVDDEDPVWLVVGNDVASDAYALVSFPQTADVLGDETDSGDIAHVPIPYGMRASYPEGLYDPPVPIVVSDDLTVVLDTPGVKPVIDGSTIINLPGPDEPTEPPESSPPVEVHGTVDALVVEVTEPFASSTTLDFHISTTPDFTPGPSTLSGSARSAVFVITGLPTGLTGSEGEDVSDGDRLQPDVTYYVRTVARNIIGSAAPGPIAPGVLDPSVVSEIITARLVAGFVLAGSIQVGNITINPETGITIPQSDGGTIHFPADGSPATITAYLNARGLRVENDLTINGVGELAGTLTMTGGAPPPKTPPTLTYGYPTTNVGPYTVGNYERMPNNNGFVAWTNGSTPRYGIMAQAFANGGQALMLHDATTGAYLRKIRMDQINGTPWGDDVLSIWTHDVALVGYYNGSSYSSPQLPTAPTNTDPYYAWVLNRVRNYDEPTPVDRYYLMLLNMGPGSDTVAPTWVRHVEVTSLLATADFSSSGHPAIAAYRNVGGTGARIYDEHVAIFWDEDADNAVKTALFDGVKPAVPQIGATQTLLTASSFTRYMNGAAFTGYRQLQLVLPTGGRSTMTQFGVTPTIAADGSLTGLTYARPSGEDEVSFPEGAGTGIANYCRGIAVDETGGSATRAAYVAYPAAGRIYQLRTDANQGRYNDYDYTFSAAYTWYDGNPVGGTHESTPSPTATISLPRMTWPIVTAPSPPHAGITDPLRPDLANRIGIYASSALVETPGPVKHQTFLPVGQRAIAAGGLHPGTLATSIAPPTVDGFASTTETPGTIQSSAADATGPLIKLDETGAWRLGGLSGDGSGIPRGQGRIQAGVSTYRATANSTAPGTILGQESTPTVWSNSILRGFTYSGAGAWTCQPGAAGTYFVWAKVSWAGDTSADWACGLQIWKNGVQMGGIGDITLHSRAIANSTGPVLLAPIEIAVGDQMAMSAWQNSGSARAPNGVQFYVVPTLS